MTIDKDHDVIMRILHEENDMTYSSDGGHAPLYSDDYNYNNMFPFYSDNGSDVIGLGHGQDELYDEYELLPPKAPISCRPKPGPFMPCDDLFGWWSLRCGVWIVFLLALLGNFVVFFVSVTSRSKMDVPRFLICNLAMADFFMGIYLGMLAIVDASTLGQFKKYAIQWQLSPGCLVAGFLGVFSSELSVFTLTVITLERFYAITHAMQLNKRLSLKHSSLIMLCGWIFCFGIAVLPLFGISDYRNFAVCLPFEIGDILSKSYVCFIMTFNGIAFFIILSCYLIMYISIRDSQAWNSNETRVAKRMALLVFTDFMCWAPIAFLSLASAFGKHLIHLNEAKVLTIFILPLNSCANPFLYAFFTKQFKKDCVLFCRRLEDSSIARHFSQVSQRHVSVSWKCQRRQSGMNSLMGDGKSQDSHNNSHASNSYGLVNHYHSEVSSGGTNKEVNVKDGKDTSWVKEVKTSVRTPPKVACSLDGEGVGNVYSDGKYFPSVGVGVRDDYRYTPCPNADVTDDVDAAVPTPVVDAGVARMGDAQVTLHEEPPSQTRRAKQSVVRTSHGGRCNHAECSQHPLNQRASSFTQNYHKPPLDKESGIVSDEESSVWKKMSADTQDVTLTSFKTLPTSPLHYSKTGGVDGYYSVDRPQHSPQRDVTDKQHKGRFQITSTYLPTDHINTCNTENTQQGQNIHISSHNSTGSKHNKRRKNIHCCSANSSPIEQKIYDFSSLDQTRHKKKGQGHSKMAARKSPLDIQYVRGMPQESGFLPTRDEMDNVDDDDKLSHVLKSFSSKPNNDNGKLFPDNGCNRVVVPDSERSEKFDNSEPLVADINQIALENNATRSSYLDKNQYNMAEPGCHGDRRSISPNVKHKHVKDKARNSDAPRHKSGKSKSTRQPPVDQNSSEFPVLTREFLHHHRTVDKSVHLRYFQQSIQGHEFLCKSNSLVELTQSHVNEGKGGQLHSSRETIALTKRGSLTSTTHHDSYCSMLEAEAGQNLIQHYNHLKQPPHGHQQQKCHHNHHHHPPHPHHPYNSSSKHHHHSSSGDVSDEVLACSQCDSLEMVDYSGEHTLESLEEDLNNNSNTNTTGDLLEGFAYRNVSSSDWKHAKQEEIGGLLADSDSTDEIDGKNDSMSSTRHSADKESGFHSQI